MHKTPVAATLTDRTVTATRFKVANTIDGYEVIDNDGRSVSNYYDHANRALELAGRLNDAAAAGASALRRELGAAYADDEAEYEALFEELDWSPVAAR